MPYFMSYKVLVNGAEFCHDADWIVSDLNERMQEIVIKIHI